MRVPTSFAHSRATLSALILVLSGGLLPGCGGGGASAEPIVQTGRLTVNIAWPTGTGRVIPENAQSLKVEALRGGVVFDTKLVARPGASAVFAELPVGPLVIRSTAYPTADGTGVALAVADAPATITADADAAVEVTMASTVATLVSSPASVTLAAGGTGTLVVTARNTAGEAVLLAPSSLSFVSANPAIVTVASSGLYTSVGGAGTTAITVTESGSGATLSIPVAVTDEINVSPTTATLTLDGTVSFSASSPGGGSPTVTWTVQEANGGTVAANGTYTAPRRKGTYHVVATSLSDPSLTATATVTVRSGSGTVTVK